MFTNNKKKERKKYKLEIHCGEKYCLVHLHFSALYCAFLYKNLNEYVNEIIAHNSFFQSTFKKTIF